MQVGSAAPGARVGRPGGDRASAVRTTRSPGTSQTAKWRRAGREHAASSRRAARQPPRVCASNAARDGIRSVVGVVPGGGPDRPPRVERRHRGVRAERQRDAGRGASPRTGSSAAPGRRRAAGRTVPSAPPQQRVEHRLHAGDHAERRRAPRSAPASTISTCSSRCRAGTHARRRRAPSAAAAKPGDHGGHGPVADRVEAGLEAGRVQATTWSRTCSAVR